MCKGVPRRYETQKAARQLRLIYHFELRKRVGVWDYKRVEGREVQLMFGKRRLNCYADKFLRQ